MSDIPDMISALVKDDKVGAESHFNSSMSQKIGGALDLKRIEVANSVVKGQSDTSLENSTDEEI